MNFLILECFAKDLPSIGCEYISKDDVWQVLKIINILGYSKHLCFRSPSRGVKTVSQYSL